MLAMALPVFAEEASTSDKDAIEYAVKGQSFLQAVPKHAIERIHGICCAVRGICSEYGVYEVGMDVIRLDCVEITVIGEESQLGLCELHRVVHKKAVPIDSMASLVVQSV